MPQLDVSKSVNRNLGSEPAIECGKISLFTVKCAFRRCESWNELRLSVLTSPRADPSKLFENRKAWCTNPYLDSALQQIQN